MNLDFMRRAIAIAASSVDQPGTMPYGSVVVRNGQSIGEGLNCTRQKFDPTSHAEVEAIRNACQATGSLRLENCEIYTSCEPCAMCMATIYMTGINSVYYAGTIADSMNMFDELSRIDPNWSRGYDPLTLQREIGLPITERQLQSQQVMGSEAVEVFRRFVESQL